MTSGRDGVSGCSSTKIAVFCGGNGSSGNLNTIEKVTVATTGNSSDFGDLTVIGTAGAASSNGTRGVMMGGSPGTGSGSRGETIDYFTIPAGGDATDFGNMATPINYNQGASGD